MKRKKLVIAAAAALALIAGGTAAGAAEMAGPVDGAGVIHGCYYPVTAAGSHPVVLQNAGRRCPRGTTAIAWNQRGRTGPRGATGPRGLPGISHLYTYRRTFAGGFGPQIAPAGAAFQSVGSLTLPFGNYMVVATLDMQNNANAIGSDNSRNIACRLSPATDTAHVFMGGAATDDDTGSLTITVTLGRSSSVSLDCGSLTGGPDLSHVFVTGVRIDVLAVNAISAQ